jgi:hypothetical protein
MLIALQIALVRQVGERRLTGEDTPPSRMKMRGPPGATLGTR